MSSEQDLRSVSLNADSSIGIFTGPPGMLGSTVPNIGKQFCFVKVTGTRQAGLCTAATDLHVGILQNKPQQAGAAATVGYTGISMVVAGANNIAAGDLVASDGSGRAVTDGTNGRWVALQPSSAVGELISVMKIK